MAYYWLGSQNDRQSRVAQSSQNYDQVHGTPGPLVGQDAFPPGQSTYDTRRPAAFLARQFRYPVYDANTGNAFLPEQVVATVPPGQSTFASALPPRAAARSVDLLTFTDASENWLFGTDAMASGDQAFDLPPKAARRLADYTFLDSSEFWLFGTDAVTAGAQRTDLPPLGVARARDYSWAQDLIPNLIGQDSMAAGQQSFALPPAPAPLRARDYSITASFPLTLISQDAMLVGDQHTALAPIAPLRARDYSFTPPVNLPALTTVVQQIPYGAQLTDSLPARAAARARDYTWTQDLIPNLIGQDQFNAGSQSFALAPSPAPLRARDYSISESFPLTLIGQDAMAAGAQFTALPPSGALRARDYSFVPPANLNCLTTVQQPIPPGQQSTDNLSPKAAQRARDYTHIDQTRRQLIGQDAMPTGQNADRTALPPKAAARARDYTWLQTYPLYIFEQLPPGDSTALTEGPPKGPLRLRDYTHLLPVQTQLIGQDAMVVGQQWLDTDNLSPRAPARMVDYTWLQRLNISEVLLLTHPGHHEVTDSEKFVHALSDRAKFIHTVGVRG